jgi:hypothetical protein
MTAHRPMVENNMAALPADEFDGEKSNNFFW